MFSIKLLLDKYEYHLNKFCDNEVCIGDCRSFKDQHKIILPNMELKNNCLIKYIY